MGLSVIFPRSLIGVHFFAAMNEGEVTILLGVPRLYSAFFNAIGQGVAARSGILRGAFHAAMFVSIAVQKAFRLDWSAWLFASLRHRIAPRLRLLVSGGAPLEPDLARNIRALGWPVASGYGLTETSPILTFNMPGLCPVKSAGRPLPGVQLRIAEPAPGLRHGEVQAKGPNVFACYLNLPEKTQAAFTQDGWFRTGDLGYLDESGALYLIGRTSSMIVLPGGENIVPDNLEERLEESSYIAEIGILEHEGRLVGVAVPGRALEQTSQDLGMEQRIREEIAKLCEGLPSYQRLGDVVLDAGPLPRTRLGKIRRPKLAQLYTQLRSSRSQSEASAPAPPRLSQEDSQLLEDPVAAGVWAWLSERFPEHRLSPDTNVRMDLGVDSLEWLNLTLEIRNRVSVELSDDAVGRIQTVRDLLQECAAAEYAVGVPGEILDALRDPQSLLDQRARDRFEVHPWLAGILDPVAVLMARTLMKALFRFRVEGLSHLPILGPYVVAPNHCSSLDPIAVTAALGSRRLHDTYWAGWVGILFRSPLASLLSRVMRVLPVEPRLGPLSNLALAAAALARGGNLIWFPEGRRSPTGELQKFLPGIGILLRAYSVPVVPVWIEGSAQALPPGTLRPRRSPVALRFGEPVLAARLEAEGCGETSDERIADGLRARVQALSGLANQAGGVSGEPPR
jgi:long-chain acyl-CoA synthetase